MKGRKYLPIPQIMVIMGVIISCAYLCAAQSQGGEASMSTEGIIAITVALIGVASGLWMQVIQFKKDGNTIREVKNDTSEIKPRLQDTSENVKDIKRDITHGILGRMEKLDGVDELVGELHYQQRLKKDVPKELLPQDALVTELGRLYEKIASLERGMDLERQKVRQMELENVKLAASLEKYKDREAKRSKDSRDFSR